MRKKLHYFILALLASQTLSAGQIEEPEFIANRFIVCTKNLEEVKRIEESTHEINATISAEVVGTYRYLPCKVVNAIGNPQTILNTYSELGFSIERDQLVHAMDTVPNDTYFNQLWGMKNINQTTGGENIDLGMEKAWDISQGSKNIVVGIIDTGLKYDHPDLAANVFNNPGESGNGKETDGIDNDHNGYIDDVHGINTITGTGDPMDDDFHGTHVSGTIGAVGNNNLGVVGVNWNISLAACKFLDSHGSGAISNALVCFDYFLGLKKAGANIIATNNSWAGGGFSSSSFTAIQQQRDAGILMIAAAANSSSNNDLTATYPANYQLENVISVGSIDPSGQISSFSNYGQKSVHVLAPGAHILSTGIPAPTSYIMASGTSMATPHVTGLAALIAATHPAYEYFQIRNLILTSGSPGVVNGTKSISGRDFVRAAELPYATGESRGALTCQGQTLQAVAAPSPTSVVIPVGQSVSFAGYSLINCIQPSPTPLQFNIVNTSKNQTSTVVLSDNVPTNTNVANDGLFKGTWTPTRSGLYHANYPTSGSGSNNPGIINVYKTNKHTMAKIKGSACSYINIKGMNLNLSDESSTLVTLPFAVPFSHAKNALNMVTVFSNGVLSFDPNDGYATAENQHLPTNSQNILIAPYWTDLDPHGDQNVFMEVRGTAPNRAVVFEWRNVPSPISTQGVTFQTVFFEQNSTVLFNYKNTAFGVPALDNGAAATVGIQSSITQASLFSYKTPKLHNNLCIVSKVTEDTHELDDTESD